jgi:hypothetical protein
MRLEYERSSELSLFYRSYLTTQSSRVQDRTDINIGLGADWDMRSPCSKNIRYLQTRPILPK